MLLFLKTKIESRLNKTENCWLWLGAATPTGYGIVTYKGKNYYTHRIMFEATKEPIKKFYNVMHKCDNPPCCNPDHLFQGMQYQNAEDKQIKGRAAKKVGEESNNNKLTNKLVLEIYNKKGKISGKVLAKQLGLGATIVYYIWEHKRWTHVTQPNKE